MSGAGAAGAAAGASSSLIQLGGDIYAADAQERAAKNARELSERQFKEGLDFQKSTYADKLAAYKAALGRGEQQYGEGESAFLSAAEAENPELAAMQSEIEKGTAKSLQQGAGQLQAELAKSGVRGGQAARLLGRGVGEMTEKGLSDITQLKYSDVAQRAAEKRAYLAAKAGRGQAATLGGL